MSRSLYDALIAGGSDEDLGWMGSFAQAARLRRAARALAEEAVSEVEEDVPAEEFAGSTLLRLAADDGDTARYASPTPVPVADAPGWAVYLELEPTLDGGALCTVTRVWVGEGTPRDAVAVQVLVVAGAEEARLALPLEGGQVQELTALSATGAVSVLAWRC